MKSITQLTFIIVTLILSSFCLAQQAEIYFQFGRFEEAAASLEETVATLSADHSPIAYVDTSIQLAAAYQALGRLQRALEVLERAKSIAEKSGDPVSRANVLSQLSDIYLAMRDLTREDLRQLLRLSLDDASPTVMMERAQHYLELAEEMVKHANTNLEARLILANILNKKGNFFVIQKKYERALESYEESKRLAKEAGDDVLFVKSSLNQLQALIESGETDSIEKELTDKVILQRVKQLPDSHDKAFALLRLAYLVQFSSDEERSRGSQSPQKRRYAYETLQQAQEVAEKQRDNLAIAYAKGDLAQLYAKERRYEEAIKLTQQAIFYSPSFAAKIFGKRPELLFRWQWQLGKYLKAQGRIKEARMAYKQAKKQLQTARKIYRCGPEAVCKNVQTFYFELVDLLLQQTSHEGTTPGEYQLLEDVIENIESFRSAELRNVLDCPKQSLETLENLWRQLPESTVVLYPIVLDDRLELLLVSRSGIQRFPVAVKQEELRKEVDKQLDNIGNFRSLVIDGYRHGKRNHELPPVDKLYQWLIKPIEKTLEEQKVKTLVMVPFGNLTRLPFAALYDGQTYLVEKYALAVISGLRFTDFTTPPQSEPTRALLVGASNFERFPELNLGYVNLELHEIAEILGGGKADILAGKHSTLTAIEKKWNAHPYSIIHFAAHGYFSDSPGETFLQTYDAPLSINKLWEIIKTQNVGQPLDLLTLSASYTALKGERSSLELMGVALKTEARSVLASLWNVNDEATAKLMIEFYRQWQQNGFSNKAKALQQAQLELLKTPGFEHPYYWASFVLIGNWQ